MAMKKILMNIYCPLTKLREDTVFNHVCLFTWGGDVDTETPQTKTPLWTETLSRQRPRTEIPRTETPPPTVDLMAATAAGGKHPTGMILVLNEFNLEVLR